MKIYKLFFIFVLIISQTVAALPFSSHRFHTSLTRIDYNEEQKLLEITIQVFNHDLVSVLKSKNGKPVDLEKTPDIDKLIFDYLNENFVLTNANGETKTLKWIGKDSDADSARIYLETNSADNLEGYKLKNTIFFESFPEQKNLVVCRYDGKKSDLMFKVGDKVKEIKGSEK
jgi:hypothetical protein